MNYLGSYKFIFRRSDWFVNGLLVLVCQMIPIVGPMVLFGYMHEIFLLQLQNPEAEYPRFNFGRFSDYLMRGVYPFLVAFVVSFVMMPFIYLSMAPVFALPILRLDGPVVMVPILASIVMYILVLTIFSLVKMPLFLRALLMQEFGGAFQVRFWKQFVGKMWWEILMLNLFLGVTSIPLVIGGLLCCVVGIYGVAIWILFAAWALQIQLYRLYLSRGGEPIPMKVFPPPQFGVQGPGFEVQR